MGKGLQRLLEEAVDSTDGKGGIVMEDGRQIASRLVPGIVFALTGPVPYKERKVLRRRGILRQDKQFAEDSRFHLVGRLVGKGDRKDMAVSVRIARGKEQTNVFVGEAEGLSGARRCFQDPYHLPQIILKSHHSQCSGTSVLRKGMEVSTISERVPESPSRTREANFALISWSWT